MHVRSAWSHSGWMRKFWKRLCNYWGTPKFKAEGERNKRNCASDYGGFGSFLHTGGSILFTQAQRCLVIVLLLHFLVCWWYISILYLVFHHIKLILGENLGKRANCRGVNLVHPLKKKKSSSERSGDKWVDKRSEDAHVSSCTLLLVFCYIFLVFVVRNMILVTYAKLWFVLSF